MTLTTRLTAPKQARAVATRKKLLKATVQCLCETGYAGTTTTHVAQSAGVSQGALYKHFGSKQQLMAATAGHLFGELISDFRAAFAAGAQEEDRIKRALVELWSVFLTPELYAVLELYMVSRTDPVLRKALAPVLLNHRQNLRVEAQTLFPEAAIQNPRFDAGVEAILAAMQGTALSVAVLGDTLDGVAFNQFLEHVWRREFEVPYGVTK